MTTRRVWFVVGLAALGALGLSGCGDDDDQGALTEDEYIEQANALCVEGNAELEDAADEAFGGETPTGEQLADFADTFDESVSEQINDLEELPGPDDFMEELEPVLDQARSALADFTELLRTDPDAAPTEDPFAEVNAQLSELGLTECGQSG